MLMKWMYTGIVRPMLTYACHVWHGGTKTSGPMANLARIQRLGLIQIAPARKGTSTAGLEIVQGVLPLDLYIESKAVSTYMRIKHQIKVLD